MIASAPSPSPSPSLPHFSLSYSEDGGCSYYTDASFPSLEDAQYALDRLRDTEEDRSSLSLRDAIAELEEQISAHLAFL
jgi:hypothetical protein